jgi:hypothetical protein
MIYKTYFGSALVIIFRFTLCADDARIFPETIAQYDRNIPIFVLADTIESQPFEDAGSTLIYLDRVTQGRETLLLWWKSQRSDVRKLAVFLMAKSISDAVVGDALRNELLEAAARFSDSEKKARLEEIDWVWGRMPQLTERWIELEAK